MIFPPCWAKATACPSAQTSVPVRLSPASSCRGFVIIMKIRHKSLKSLACLLFTCCRRCCGWGCLCNLSVACKKKSIVPICALLISASQRFGSTSIVTELALPKLVRECLDLLFFVYCTYPFASRFYLLNLARRIWTYCLRARRYYAA